MKQLILLLLSKFQAHMSFQGGSGGRRERGFNHGREKSPAVGRGDDGRHQASDEAHASFFFL